MKFLLSIALVFVSTIQAIRTGVDDIIRACRAAGYNAPRQHAQAVSQGIHQIPAGQQAMFLAQLIHESGGLQYIEECAYAGRQNHGSYLDNHGLPGRDYHGRGFIQLSWGANYKAASEYLGYGQRLLENPGLVSQDPKLAMDVSVFYWNTRVATNSEVQNRRFGATTRMINGGLECNGQNLAQSQERYNIYLKVARELGETNLASEGGCYN